jgi:indole-3-glycerol phosphate synthase
MPADLLATIAEKRRSRIAERRARSAGELPPRPADLPPPRAGAFRAALRRSAPGDPLHLIGELKKASPSKGVLREDFDVPALARAYAAGGATALSVLTEPDWFQGRPEDLTRARRASGLPCLMKDFVVDPWQLDEAVSLGADAVLLIVALLSIDGLRGLLRMAGARGLDALVEVHTEAELELALDAEADLVGVNNRDLTTFTVDPGRVLRLRPGIPAGVVVVAESGIASPADVRALAAAGIDAALVGEAFMKSADPEAAVAEFAAAAAAAPPP